jgi:hypothetical protein
LHPRQDWKSGWRSFILCLAVWPTTRTERSSHYSSNLDLGKGIYFRYPFAKSWEDVKKEATLALTEAEIFEHAEFWPYLELGMVGDIPYSYCKNGKCRIFIVLINHFISQITAPSSLTVIEIQSIDVRVSTIYRGFLQVSIQMYY